MPRLSLLQLGGQDPLPRLPVGSSPGRGRLESALPGPAKAAAGNERTSGGARGSPPTPPPGRGAGDGLRLRGRASGSARALIFLAEGAGLGVRCGLQDVLTSRRASSRLGSGRRARFALGAAGRPGGAQGRGWCCCCCCWCWWCCWWRWWWRRWWEAACRRTPSPGLGVSGALCEGSAVPGSQPCLNPVSAACALLRGSQRRRDAALVDKCPPPSTR